MDWCPGMPHSSLETWASPVTSRGNVTGHGTRGPSKGPGAVPRGTSRGPSHSPAAVAFRFKVLPADVDAFINVTLTARQVRLYADGPVLPPPPPVDPFASVLQFVEATVTKAAAAVEGKVRVRPLLSKNASLEMLVITSTIATRDRLHQLPAFREALESMRGQLLREKIALRRVAIEAQEVIDRIDHLITAEDIIRKGEAPQLRFDQGAWDVIRQLWPFGTR